MPNPNYCGPVDDIKLYQYDITKSQPYKQCHLPISERTCRFAYANWCPVCADPHRRRSKSESADIHICKRGRDITNSPKKCDYSKNCYLETKKATSSGLESPVNRLRPNLCELPTTYITSNCQSKVPSTVKPEFSSTDQTYIYPYANKHKDIAPNQTPVKYPAIKCDKTSNIDTLKNSIKDYCKMKGLIEKSQHVKQLSSDITTSEQHLEKLKDLLGVKDHFNSVRMRTRSNSDSNDAEILNPCKNRFCDGPINYKNTVFDPKRLRIRPHNDNKQTTTISTASFRVHHHDDTISPSTENKLIELNDLKRQRIRPQDFDCGVKKPDDSYITKKAREVSPLEPKKDFRSRSAVKLASIKNRQKFSAVKLRKVRSKIAHSVSSDSNLSDSDFSECEDESGGDAQDLVTLKSTPVVSINGSTPIDNISAAVTLPQTSTVIDDHSKWPVRVSLFAHVPPYIEFRGHDVEPFQLQTGAGKYLKWKLSTVTPVIVRKTLLNTGFKLVRSESTLLEVITEKPSACPPVTAKPSSNEWIGTWGKHLKSACFQTLKDTQKLNHFPGTFQIGRKDRLWKNLQRLMFKYGTAEFGFIPRTFVLPHDLKLLRQVWDKTGQDKWIIKPPASARGTGIKVIHSWAHLPKKKPLVVQQYISNPYLINGSKFDLRLYVLVTSFNPLRIYLYPDGLARFASAKYSDDINSLSDRYVHLTNYSINKLSSQYSANEDANACKGHKWTISKLWEYMERQGVNTSALWRSLQQLVIKTMLCGESSITQLHRANVASRYNCYELFGVDVLLDERLKPWLLEVNISPSLHSASPLDLHVKGPLVQMLLNLAQFHLPPRISHQFKRSPKCYDPKLYTMRLTAKERAKHQRFTEPTTPREQYLTPILTELTGDDVRHLTQAEDELCAIGRFERVFPTQHTHRYLQYMEVRYYNRLFDAWETRYEKDRKSGVKLLQELCQKKVHLDVAFGANGIIHQNAMAKDAPQTTETESSPETSLTDDLSPIVQQKMSTAIETTPSPVDSEVSNVFKCAGVQYNCCL